MPPPLLAIVMVPLPPAPETLSGPAMPLVALARLTVNAVALLEFKVMLPPAPLVPPGTLRPRAPVTSKLPVVTVPAVNVMEAPLPVLVVGEALMMPEVGFGL